jgi:cysteine desulfurase
MERPIYLDYNATTPISPEAVEAMMPYLYEHFGNPSSSHPYGLMARKGVEEARVKVANLLNCQPTEVIFTSSGTESNNYALRGAAFANRNRGSHIITSAVEHPAVTEVCRWLETQGFNLTILPVDTYGLVDPDDLKEAITSETILVSVMHANNEVGTIQPIQTLAKITHDQGAIFHTDSAQSVGKVWVDVESLGVDALSLAGHKLYAPKGVGVLYLRSEVKLEKLMQGAGHENGRRSGTENVPDIVGLGSACVAAKRDLKEIQSHFQTMRDRLHKGLEAALGSDRVKLNGHPTKRLPNTLNLSFRDVAADELLAAVNHQVAASAGSACHADQGTISGVLGAMGVPIEWAQGAIRFSVGRSSRPGEIDQAIQAIVKAVWELG